MPPIGRPDTTTGPLVRHVSWQTLSVIVQAGTQIGVIALLARFLSPEEFGLVAAANVTITLVQMIAEGGVGAAVVQRQSISPDFVRGSMAVSLIISIGSVLLLWLLAFPFQDLLQMEALGLVIAVLAVASPFSGVASLLEGLLQRDLHFESLFRINLVGSVAGYALPAIVLAIAGAGVWALVAATLGRVVVKCGLVVWLYSGSLRPRWDALVAGDLLRFGLGLTQDRFWLWLSAQAAPLAIAFLFGQEQLGQFYMGTQLAVLPVQYLSSIVSAVYFPIVARSLKDHAVAGSQFVGLMSTCFVVATIIGLAAAVNSTGVVTLMFGPGWDNAVLVFEILCIGAGVRACLQICDNVNIARGDVYALAGRRAITSVAMFSGMYLFVDAGLGGAAWVMNGAHGLMLLLSIMLVVRGLDIRWSVMSGKVRRLLLTLAVVGAAELPLFYAREAGTMGGVTLVVVSVLVNGVMVAVVAPIIGGRFERLAVGGGSVSPPGGD